MAERWIIDTGRPLVLPLSARQGVVRVTEQATPNPPLRTQFAQRPEGGLPTSRERENRTITLKLELAPPTDQWAKVQHDFGAPPTEAQGDGDVPGWRGTVRRVDAGGSAIGPAISDLAAAVGALTSVGSESVSGTLTRVLEDGERITFDVLQCEADAPSWDLPYFVAGLTSVTLTFTCLPFGRGQERLVSQGTIATGQRFLTLNNVMVPGDVPALARMQLSSAGTAQQSILYAVDQPDVASQITGVQIPCATLDLSPTTTVEPNDSSVAPTVARRLAFGYSVPPDTWEPVTSLRKTGNAVDVRGEYRVWARVLCSRVTQATLRLRWSAGPRAGGMTINAPQGAALSDGWQLLDLGLVSVPSGGSLDGFIERMLPHDAATLLDVLLLVPTDRSGVATASATPAPASVTAVDRFAGTGILQGTSADVGGPWVKVGTSPTDFVRNTGEVFRKVASGSISESVPVPSPACRVSVRASTGDPAGTGAPGTDNGGYGLPIAGGGYYGIWIGNTSGINALLTGTGVAGAWAAILAVENDGLPQTQSNVEANYQSVREALGEARTAWPVGEIVTLRYVYNTTIGRLTYAGTGIRASARNTTMTLEQTAGIIRATVSSEYLPLVVGTGVMPVPAASGLRGGIVHTGTQYRSYAESTSSLFPLRQAFSAFTVTAQEGLNDQALYPGGRAEFATGATTRTTPDGLNGPVARHEGDRPTLPPSGREARPVRVVLGTTQGDLRARLDAGPTSFTGKVYATPRYLQIPDGA